MGTDLLLSFCKYALDRDLIRTKVTRHCAVAQLRNWSIDLNLQLVTELASFPYYRLGSHGLIQSHQFLLKYVKTFGAALFYLTIFTGVPI